MKDDLSSIINKFNNNKQNNQNIIPVAILLNNDFNILVKSLLFTELSELCLFLLLNNNKKEYEKKEKDIIASLKKDEYNDAKQIVNKLLLINPDEIDEDKNYNLIDIEFLKLINKSKKFISKIETCYYFINNNEKYIFYSDKQMLYKLEMCNKKNKEYKLKYMVGLDFKEIPQYLSLLYNNEIKIKRHSNNTLKDISNPEEY
jgi:hypothetical protein